jgi:hypothetical protein
MRRHEVGAGVARRCVSMREFIWSAGIAVPGSGATIGRPAAPSASVWAGNLPSGGSMNQRRPVIDQHVGHPLSAVRGASALIYLRFLKAAMKYPSGAAASLPELGAKILCARRFNSTTSSVRNWRSSSSLGHSKGVAELFDQFPCRSGWPSCMRGMAFTEADFFAGADWPYAVNEIAPTVSQAADFNLKKFQHVHNSSDGRIADDT